LDEYLHPLVSDDTQLLPDIIDSEEEYEVEWILDHQGGKHQQEYLVKWRGYPVSDMTWKLKWSLHHAPDAILCYKERLEG
jgi:hypothetical protein